MGQAENKSGGAGGKISRQDAEKYNPGAIGRDKWPNAEIRTYTQAVKSILRQKVPDEERHLISLVQTSISGRRAGRTRLQAVAVILEAMSRPGESIYLVAPTTDNLRYVIDTVNDIIHEMKHCTICKTLASAAGKEDFWQMFFFEPVNDRIAELYYDTGQEEESLETGV
jgi:hypothetical protein